MNQSEKKTNTNEKNDNCVLRAHPVCCIKSEI